MVDSISLLPVLISNHFDSSLIKPYRGSSHNRILFLRLQTAISVENVGTHIFWKRSKILGQTLSSF
ncbi:hypothetical protein B1J93_06890 [Leptospira kirschneri serovar Pomona]|uniref:Uncharacterized protein n=1 Tax=Leptospira kirschneri serovar Pomona TaxID=561005 RepID=A0A1T1DT69_9LEPT|nr:hypothetical protein LEP1GSC127_3910 [Leptospira kirschneri str. 200801925]KPZ78459.1 hypothetical protein APS47_00220 [Leptospira kirschneri serovar Mozdok]OOV43930.1 hypothetical protein B1J93_06890 [Leptospira kirschneri serovar Pomona]OOV50398.1 hypothetical protein B1J94_00290 [Leptospira kirschneri serovar Grippotyphosa]